MNQLKKTKRNLKRKVALSTGMPTTKSGRKKKAVDFQGQAMFWLIVIGIVVYVFSGDSEAAMLSLNQIGTL